MEEKSNKQFEFIEEHYQFPRVIAVNYLKTDEKKFIRIIESPFNNLSTVYLSHQFDHLYSLFDYLVGLLIFVF